jgi:hypothetical protein
MEEDNLVNHVLINKIKLFIEHIIISYNYYDDINEPLSVCYRKKFLKLNL